LNGSNSAVIAANVSSGYGLSRISGGTPIKLRAAAEFGDGHEDYHPSLSEPRFMGLEDYQDASHPAHPLILQIPVQTMPYPPPTAGKTLMLSFG
jgi:hypothetical protein